jgi:hypothetical protein
MALRLNAEVMAVRDIKRVPDVRIARGTPGKIIQYGGIVTLKNSVKFHPKGGKPVVVNRLTWRDVHGVRGFRLTFAQTVPSDVAP